MQVNNKEKDLYTNLYEAFYGTEGVDTPIGSPVPDNLPAEILSVEAPSEILSDEETRVETNVVTSEILYIEEPPDVVTQMEFSEEPKEFSEEPKVFSEEPKGFPEEPKLFHESIPTTSNEQVFSEEKESKVEWANMGMIFSAFAVGTLMAISAYKGMKK